MEATIDLEWDDWMLFQNYVEKQAREAAKRKILDPYSLLMWKLADADAWMAYAEAHCRQARKGLQPA